MRQQDDESRFRWATIGTILLVFAAAAAVTSYAYWSSAGHFDDAALQRQVEQAGARTAGEAPGH